MTATTIPFGGILRLGSKGPQPVAVKRGLYRASQRKGWESLDCDAIAQEVYGPLAVENCMSFQQLVRLTVDGVYGPKTHAKLRPFFDAYAEFLYRPPGLVLPANFIPTHETAGLPGYPAIDVFGRPGIDVYAPATGIVSRLSGHDPREGGTPGGAYGWSIYIDAPILNCQYYLTHFGTRRVKAGDQVTVGTIIGTVCDAAVAHMASSASHIHEGRHDE